jgi:hypothetical protein
MEISEHHYFDDPKNGHIDVKTTLKDVEYFFLGNGYMEIAIQYSPSGEGTPLGLLIMDPEKFGPKRDALSINHDTGISKTQLFIECNNIKYIPTLQDLNVYWKEIKTIPAVEAKWKAENIDVTEIFYCPDRETSTLIRNVKIFNKTNIDREINIKTGIKTKSISKKISCNANSSESIFIKYNINNNNLDLYFVENDSATITEKAETFWKNTAFGDFGSSKLNHLFKTSKYQIQANTSQSGRMDASIWQYNLEWVRDMSNTVMGMIVAGQFELANTILTRMLKYFVTDNGDTVDSSKVRPHSETELDQNGELLLALNMYVEWTGDFNLIQNNWEKIKAVANFPLKKVFEHSSGLLHNQRDLWERHHEFGIEDGMELAYQLYVSIGLKCAAEFAEQMDETNLSKIWNTASDKIKNAMINDPRFSLVHNDHFIKRRKIDESIQWKTNPLANLQLHPETPLGSPITHYLNPDCSYSFPVSLEFIDPKCDLAVNTMNETDKLWNMNWSGGGHSRYNISSEPDSPGPWPLASILIAQGWFQTGNDEKVWEALNWLQNVPGNKSGGWFEFYGPRPVPPCPQIGIIPWTWGEVMKLFIHHFMGIRPAGDKLILKPRLLSGIDKMTVSVRIRNFRLILSIEKNNLKENVYILNGSKIKYNGISIQIPMPEKDTKIELYV